MKRSLCFAATALAMAGSAGAAAKILASGKIYGGPGQSEVACYIVNTGSNTVQLSQWVIADQNGQKPFQAQQNCSSTLAAGQGCVLATYSTLSPSAAYDCLVAGKSLAALRGSVEVRAQGSGQTIVLQSQAMR